MEGDMVGKQRDLRDVQAGIESATAKLAGPPMGLAEAKAKDEEREEAAIQRKRLQISSENWIEVQIAPNGSGSRCGTVNSNLMEPVSFVNEGVSWTLWNAAVDVVESMVLAHALAGVDVESEAYLGGLRASLDAIGSYFASDDEMLPGMVLSQLDDATAEEIDVKQGKGA